MPGTKAFEKFEAGTLHSGSKQGPLVHNRKQAIAIYLSEKRKAGGGVLAKAKQHMKGKRGY